MELEHEFTVQAPVDHAWDVLLDLERIAPCMPGATLTSYSGDEFTGTVRVKLGPVTMTFAGQGRFVERDPRGHTMVVEASGKDRRGGGTARATVRAGLRDDGGTTRVAVHTDLVVTGRAAQFGRGMIADVSGRLLGQFTECLAGQLGGGGPASAAVPAQAGSPAGGSADLAAAPADGSPADDAEPATPGAAAAELPAAGGLARSGAGTAVPDPEPIDLLGVTGVRSATARAVPYVVVFLLGALVGAGLVGAGLVAWLG